MKPRSALVTSGVVLAAGAVLAVLAHTPEPAITDLPDLIQIPSGDYVYRPAGEFRIGNRVVDAPLQHRTATADLAIMKYPVSQAAYAACVDDGVCLPAISTNATDLAQTDVSFNDASTYASWYSKLTRQTWRLPTDDEWVRAAGDRYFDDALGEAADAEDPSKRWLLKYRQQAAERGTADPRLRPFGAFGENNHGVADISGNVWEWTDTCFQNVGLAEDGQTVIASSNYCGVRVVQGKHRTFIIDFVRDARAGGCAVGIPPDHLGFRLVRSATPG